MKKASSPQTVPHKAMEISDPAKRVAYIDTACGWDEELRQEVEAVLATHDALGVKSACFAVRSHFGICAHQAPLIARVGNLFPDWEIIIAKDGDWDSHDDTFRQHGAEPLCHAPVAGVLPCETPARRCGSS